MANCIVPGCNSNSSKSEKCPRRSHLKKKTYHTVPKRFVETLLKLRSFKAWSKKDGKICSDHFKIEDITEYPSRKHSRVSKTAVLLLDTLKKPDQRTRRTKAQLAADAAAEAASEEAASAATSNEDDSYPEAQKEAAAALGCTIDEHQSDGLTCKKKTARVSKKKIYLPEDNRFSDEEQSTQNCTKSSVYSSQILSDEAGLAHRRTPKKKIAKPSSTELDYTISGQRKAKAQAEKELDLERYNEIAYAHCLYAENEAILAGRVLTKEEREELIMQFPPLASPPHSPPKTTGVVKISKFNLINIS